MLAQKIGVLLGVCLVSLAFMGAGFEDLPIREIHIRGNRKIENQAILHKLQSKTGEPFRPEKIEQDIKAIYGIGYFEDIKVDVQEIEGGLSITYLVSERPLIKKITFHGNKEFKAETLLEKINLKSGSIYSPNLVNNDIQNLTQFYRSEGYYLAEITSIGEEISKDWMELIFDINEREKVKIGKVILEGNRSYPDKQIKKFMKTKKYGFFSFFTSSGHLNKDFLSQDIQKIEDYYLNHGFLHVAIQEPEILFDPEKSSLTVLIPIQEGEQYRIGSLQILGNKVLSKMDIQQCLQTRSGDIFNRAQLRQDITSVQDRYAEKGYVFSRIIPIIRELPEENNINLTLDIEEGELTYINRIRIIGNIKTRDKVIRREVRLMEGDIFNSRKIRRSYNNINNLGFFDEVNIDIQPEPEKSMVDLVIKVKERMTGQMSVGAGYSSQDKLVGTIEVKQGNLFGRGQRLSVSAEKSGSRTTYDIGFTEPWLFDIPLSAGFDLYYVDKEYDTFIKNARGGDIHLGYPVAEYTRLSGTYLYENVDLDIEDPNSVSPDIRAAEGTSSTSSIRLSLVRDSRDDRIKPASGSLNRLSFQVAGGLLGGTNYFTKTIFDSGWHFPVWKKLVLSLHGRIGYAAGFRGRELPVFERFYAGGLDTVRGYDERSIGPIDVNGDPVGGDKLVVTNVELHFPIYDIIRGVLFWDAGNVFGEDEHGENEKFFQRPLRMGAGAGVRFFTPIGPLRLDLGFPINRQASEKAQVWHFAIGTYF
ncbi:MAG: outer membrane protein assembly factor BamA [bacterium]